MMNSKFGNQNGNTSFEIPQCKDPVVEFYFTSQFTMSLFKRESSKINHRTLSATWYKAMYIQSSFNLIKLWVRKFIKLIRLSCYFTKSTFIYFALAA